MALESEVETHLIGCARDLIEQGLSLRQGASLNVFTQWDEAVNELVEEVNRALAESDFTSRPLQRHLAMLIELYQQSLADIDSFRDDQAAKAAELHQQRWEITG